jgi:hypothetical protein
MPSPRQKKRKKRPSKDEWSRRKSDALKLAARLTALTGDRLPIDLGHVFRQRAVTSVDFWPLLGDGALVTTENGFRILVRCSRGEQREELDRLFFEDETGRRLPPEIVRQARFTIAHEIAHTFFYNIRRRPPVPIDVVTKQRDNSDVEYTCSALAGILLLPEEALRRDFRHADLLEPELLKKISDMALISRPALVRRLRNLQRTDHPYGVITAIQRAKGGWRISALSAHYSMPRTLEQGFWDKSVNSIAGSRASMLIEGVIAPFEFTWIDPADATKWTFLCSSEPKREGQASLFLTFRRIDR